MKRTKEFLTPSIFRGVEDGDSSLQCRAALDKATLEERIEIAEQLRLSGRSDQEVNAYEAGLLTHFFFGP
jgi:hypothetical protein